MRAGTLKPAEHFILDEPYYEPVANEIEIFNAAYRNQLPLLQKGPTGCGKTRFVEHMAWRLNRPLITASCHDYLTASDLVGCFLITGGETTWSAAVSRGSTSCRVTSRHSGMGKTRECPALSCCCH